MLKLITRIPSSEFAIAVSGGIDSMVCLDFLRRFPNNRFSVLHFNHGTEHGKEAEEFVSNFCSENNLPLLIGRIASEKLKKESQEEYWRRERYSFFSKFCLPIITCHHLNDVLETWIFTSLRGEGKLIPFKRDNFIRPFLLTSKKEIKDWVERNDLKWCEDKSNSENIHSRNIIRNELMPIALKVNPGLEKMMRKKLMEMKNSKNK